MAVLVSPWMVVWHRNLPDWSGTVYPDGNGNWLCQRGSVLYVHVYWHRSTRTFQRIGWFQRSVMDVRDPLLTRRQFFRKTRELAHV